MAFNWTCPYCNRDQVVTDSNCDDSKEFLGLTRGSNLGAVGLETLYIVCSNDECQKIRLKAFLKKMTKDSFGNDKFTDEIIHTWDLLPESTAKPQPDFIPPQLVQDYYEACRICDLSPKASATLSRRCVQGMIRDFCKISKSRLIDEIKELEKLSEEGKLPSGVTSDSIEAIDHIRSLGNIGAHFEKDINVIVEVDPGEAQALIDLIELLFEEWYIAADTRKKKLQKIKEIREQKDMQKKKSDSSKTSDSNKAA